MGEGRASVSLTGRDIPVFGRQLVFGAQQVSWRSLGAPAGLAAKLPSSKGR